MDQMVAEVKPSPVAAQVRECERTYAALYWGLGAVLLLYVALCTQNRDSVYGADAWEHHRAIVALLENPWHPGNPTYATDEPSIRYSPYTVALTLICRLTSVDPYVALGAAGVFNTALLIIALYVLLRTYGLAAMAPTALLVMVSLYGVAPGYANSYALADLPWHQVNPSALSFPLALFMFALLRNSADKPRAWVSIAAITILAAICILTHGHTGVFAFIGMGAIAVGAPAELRWRLLCRVTAVSVMTFLLCLAWPLYNFLGAVLTNQDQEYWFNPFVSIAMLSIWAAPALFCVPVLLSLRRNELARFCLIGAAISFGLGLLSFPLRSGLLARIPMPAMVLLHIPIGLYIYEHRLFNPRTWRRNLQALFSYRPAVAAPAAINVLVLAAFAYCLIPQLLNIPRNPALARSYLAPLIGKQDKQLRLMSKYREVLEPIAAHDVVMSDIVSSWPVPSFNGRIIAALHYETFTPGQPQRQRDLETFFATNDYHIREQILHHYGAKWIVLNRYQMLPQVVDEMLEPQAVVREVDPLILMNAEKWLSLRRAKTQPAQIADTR